MDDVLIRDATATDIVDIVSIYNDVLATTSAIWTEQLTSVGEREAWLADKQADGYPVLVAVDGSGCSVLLPAVPSGPGRGIDGR